MHTYCLDAWYCYTNTCLKQNIYEFHHKAYLQVCAYRYASVYLMPLVV